MEETAATAAATSAATSAATKPAPAASDQPMEEEAAEAAAAAPSIGAPPQRAGHRTILMALDCSDSSWAALRWALENVVRPPHDRLVLMSAVAPVVSYTGMTGRPGMHLSDSFVKDESHRRRSSALALLNRARSACAEHQVQAEVRVHTGDARTAVVELASEVGADLVIVGSRGHGPLQRLLLGSVSEYCVHHCTMPVLVYRPATAAAKMVAAADAAPAAAVRSAPATAAATAGGEEKIETESTAAATAEDAAREAGEGEPLVSN
ncbi:hypothetical protein CLOM_g8837 [Closterium sp. NIES-68]|nr:hypothetical protein CLOM_g8837 [Closterium sp. NIES-68]